MSYILDALKKAESERERGAVPGLNSAQENHSTYIHYGSHQKPWWLLALGLGVLLALGAAFLAWRSVAPGPSNAITGPALAPTSVVAVSPVVLASTPIPIQVPTSARLPVPEANAPALVVQKPGLPVRAQLPRLIPDTVAAKASPLAADASALAHGQPKVAPVPTSPTLPPVQVVAAPVEAPGKPSSSSAPIRSASGGVPMLSELPDALRRQIPPLNISGAIYSDSPPEWTLIINDQVMGKGSQVAPDVHLEEISASSAVFNFKGQRFRMER